MAEVVLDQAVARRILAVLDVVGEVGLLAYRGDPEADDEVDRAEVADLATHLYEKLRPPLAKGDRVTDGTRAGTLAMLVLTPEGWEAWVDWDGAGVEEAPLDRLRQR